MIDGEKSICVSKIKKIFILKHRKSLKKDGDDFSVFIVIDVMQRQIFRRAAKVESSTSL